MVAARAPPRAICKRFHDALEASRIEPACQLAEAGALLGMPELVRDADEHLLAAGHRLGLGPQAGPVDLVAADVRLGAPPHARLHRRPRPEQPRPAVTFRCVVVS